MTTHQKFNKPPLHSTILVAPLEWGLGHATRCIPIIHKLLQLQCHVLLAAEGATAQLLREEFPDLTFLPLSGYRIKYSRSKKGLAFKLISQLPKVILTIYQEHRWLTKVVAKYDINAVISDNRFGLYHTSIPSVYITHQLLIKTNNPVTQRIGQWIHYRFINKYDRCWVPDSKENGLAGILSHPNKLPAHVQYIGPVSRFKKITTTNYIYDLLFVISGPEPQRTIFENIILKSVADYNGKVLFIRGLPGDSSLPACSNPNVKILNHMKASDLNIAFQQSGLIISRAGYTTVMDLVKLGKRAVLVPTPGQTEQEYLSDYLMNKNMFYSVKQHEFNLQEVLKRIPTFPFSLHLLDMEQYQRATQEFVQSLSY